MHKMLPLTVVSILVLKAFFQVSGALLRQGFPQALGGAALNSANDVSGMAKSGAGRQSIASQAANVSEDVAKSG